jgi:hypothetical protein
MAAKKSKAPKPGASPAPSVAGLPEGFTAKRSVILPTLSLQVGQPRVLRFNDAMRQSTINDPDPKKKMKPATICGVTDVQSKENYNMIVPAVLESSLKEGYPGDTYVDKTFYVLKKPKRAGKRYFDFELTEVE